MEELCSLGGNVRIPICPMRQDGTDNFQPSRGAELPPILLGESFTLQVFVQLFPVVRLKIFLFSISFPHPLKLPLSDL